MTQRWFLWRWQSSPEATPQAPAGKPTSKLILQLVLQREGVLQRKLRQRVCQNHLFYFCTNASTDLGNLKNGLVYAIFFNTRRKTISRIKDIWQSTDQEVFFSLTFFAHASLTQFCREVSSERSHPRGLGECLKVKYNLIIYVKNIFITFVIVHSIVF